MEKGEIGDTGETLRQVSVTMMDDLRQVRKVEKGEMVGEGWDGWMGRQVKTCGEPQTGAKSPKTGPSAGQWYCPLSDDDECVQ